MELVKYKNDEKEEEKWVQELNVKTVYGVILVVELAMGLKFSAQSMGHMYTQTSGMIAKIHK